MADLPPLAKRLSSLGLSADELADITKVDRSTAYRWLSGGSVPYRKYLELIASAKQLSLEWLRTGEGEPHGGGQGDGVQSDRGPVTMSAVIPAPDRSGSVQYDFSKRIPVPVVEVAGGPNGRLTVEDHTLYIDYLTPEEFVITFMHPPPVPEQVAKSEPRWCLGVLRGESMAPRYEDGERVPIELFDSPRSDVAGGDVYLVRVDGHLYLKVVDRLPSTKKGNRKARYALISYHPAYKPVEIEPEDVDDFAVLGRVVESSKQRQYGAMLARFLQL